MRIGKRNYNPNGNLTSEFVARNRLGNSTTNNISRRKLLWDGQNRIRGISEDGYVSLYWYDADGNRTVKEHLGGEAVWVNGTAVGLQNGVNRWTAFPSGFITVEDGERYTQHIFIGPERVASLRNTLGEEFTNYETTTVSAGYNVQIPVSYTSLQGTMEAAADSTCAGLEVPWRIPHTESRSCGTCFIVMSPSDDNAGKLDAEERQGRMVSTDSIYYYHRDHLGSTMLVSDRLGNIVQQVEYTPWGEVFVELRVDSTFATPYLFNGKELDEETGLYYYGARYYDPKLCVWYSTDRDQEKYPYVSSYCYTLSNPINAIDPNGELVIFINGFHTGDGGKADYWEGLNERIMQKLNDYHQRYYDGSMGGAINTITHGIATGNLNPMKRFKHGVLMGSSDAENIFASLKKNETIKIFTHSMGAAYGKGFILGLQIYAKLKGIDIKNLIEFEVDLAPYQSLMQLPAKGVNTVSIGHYWDGIAGPSFMPFAENHNTRFDKFSLNPIKEHSIDSFTINEINTYLPNVNGPKIMNKRIWEQHGTKDEK